MLWSVGPLLLLAFPISLSGVRAQRPWQQYIVSPNSRNITPLSITGNTSAGVSFPNGGTTPFRLTQPSVVGSLNWPPGTIASASSTHAPNPTTYYPSNAIDGNPATWWNDDTENVAPDVLTVTSPTSFSLPGVTLVSNSDGYPVDFYIETTSDNSTWTRRASVTGNAGLTWSAQFASPVTVTAVRVTVTKNQDGGKGIFTRIVELGPYYHPVVPYVDVDFGKVVSGHVKLTIASASNPAPQIRLAFSEAKQYLGFTSDYSRSDYSSNPTHTDDFVPAVTGQVWSDVTGCQFGTTVCADGLRAFRYMRVYIGQTPGAEAHSAPTGWVQFSAISLDFTPYLGTTDTYKGHFLSNDDLLNRIWYSSVYTVELNTDAFYSNSTEPRGAFSSTLDGKQVLFDGAKRDRDPYAGDVAVQSLVDLVSHASGTAAKNVLLDLAAHQRSDGWIPPASINGYTLSLFDYPAWWAIATVDYYLYTADTAFATSSWGALTKLFNSWYPSVTASDGLLDKSGSYSGYGDYAFLPRTGKITYYNANYAIALKAAAQLATSLGHTSEAANWTARAATVSSAVQTALWDTSAGTWFDAIGSTCHSQDAAAFATLAGISDTSRANSSLEWVTSTLARPWGTAMVDKDCFGGGTSDRVYAFLGYPEVLARFTSGDETGALEELRRTWGWMINHDPGNTTWEATGSGGNIGNYEGAFTSLAHGWAAGAAAALSNEVLGVKPLTAGFATYTVIPRVGDLVWSEGTMPTPHGGIDVSWSLAGEKFSLTVTAPSGTVGQFGVPTNNRAIEVTLDGTLVWDGSKAVGGSKASSDGRYVYVDGISSGTRNVIANPKTS